MSNVKKFNGVRITVENTGDSYHTYDDWGLYVTNTDCIKEPIQNTRYVEVFGANRLIDLTEAVTGRVTYKSREISIDLAGVRAKTDWDAVISSFRNKINGRVCRITFDNDIGYFWRGRIDIKDFSSIMRLGKFKITIPDADPYKYNVESSVDPWLWDPFNFETGVVTNPDAVKIDGETTIEIPAGHMLVSPEFLLTEITSDVTVTYNGVEYPLKRGATRIPSILVNGDEPVSLLFKGNAYVQVVYRGGSL